VKWSNLAFLEKLFALNLAGKYLSNICVANQSYTRSPLELPSMGRASYAEAGASKGNWAEDCQKAEQWEKFGLGS